MRKHFETLKPIYGDVICFNLVNKKGYELKVGGAFTDHIQRLADTHVKYVILFKNFFSMNVNVLNYYFCYERRNFLEMVKSLKNLICSIIFNLSSISTCLTVD
jgi:hypothetical protein